MKKGILYFITFLPMIVTCLVLPNMPSQIPMHYNMAGEIDRWGSKYESFIFPVLIILFSLFINRFIEHYQKVQLNSADGVELENAEKNEKACYYTALIIITVFNLTHYQMIYADFIEVRSEINTASYDFGKSLLTFMGVAIIFIGSIISKTKPNHIIGVRTKWSMENEFLWKKSNRMGSIILVLIGIVMLINTMIFTSGIAMIINIILLIIGALGCVLYSYYAFKKYSLK